LMKIEAFVFYIYFVKQASNIRNLWVGASPTEKDN